MREAFHKRFGVSFKDLRKWPRQQIDDYLMIMEIEGEIQQQESSNNTGGGSMSDSAIATQRAYEAMRAKKGG
jgi:hypothetical protein